MPDAVPPVDLNALPGHLIRRLHQIAVGIFLQETAAHGVTPVQFAALQAVHQQPGIDQRTLASRIALDTSTTAGVVDRLQERGWLQRQTDEADRRVRRLYLTPSGEQCLAAVVPAMQRAQMRILQPLSADEQAQWMAMLQRLVEANNALSRAPAAVRQSRP
jgi:DNA-binding MarR family transcriptional regulator